MLSFENYKSLALDSNLQDYEKVGFSAVHRAHKEKNIFSDILSKVDNLKKENKLVIDIGCGCSLPVRDLIDHCKDKKHSLILVDSEEMLENLDDASHITKSAHSFPLDLNFNQKFHSKADVIICYSVLHAIHYYQNIFTFVDYALSLLAPGGQMLIGDIANISKKKRFLSTSMGADFHRNWSSGLDPDVTYNELYMDVDDSSIIQLFLRYRLMGFETYILPQDDSLPLNYTREDILICKHH